MKLRILACAAGVVAGLLGAAVATAAEQKAHLKVVDFGDKFCIPCKLMAQALEELKTEQAGKLEVQFVGVGDKANLPLAKKHKISLIPTQIFFDGDGKEVWRHEGYISKHGILLEWKELGGGFETRVSNPRASSFHSSKMPCFEMYPSCRQTSLPSAVKENLGGNQIDLVFLRQRQIRPCRPR